MRRRYLAILLLVLNFTHLAACAQVRDSRATLLEEKGMPVSIVAGGGRAILTSPDRQSRSHHHALDPQLLVAAGRPQSRSAPPRRRRAISRLRHRSCAALFPPHADHSTLFHRDVVPRAAAVSNCDHCGNGVDIQAHLFINFHVLVLVSGCSVTRHIHADRLPSAGVTRVTGDKHLFSAAASRTQL